MASYCPCCGDPRPPVKWRELSVCLDAGANWEGRRFHLSPQQLSLLHHLARRAPRTVRKDALFLSSMNENVEGNMLTTQLSLMNKQLRKQGVPLKAANDFGLGYRLEATAAAQAYA